MNNTNQILLSIGTNYGNREENIENALEHLISGGVIESAIISSLYETEPFGITEQAWFLNIAVLGTTELEPLELLQICKSIEYSIGRTQRKRWHEREIDIDIIFYNDLVMNDKMLTIPHSRLESRKFVLIPSVEIAPNYIHPISKLTLKQILADCNDSSKVRIFG